MGFSRRANRVVVALGRERSVFGRVGGQIGNGIGDRVRAAECDDDSSPEGSMRHSNVAAGIGEEGSGVPGGNQFEAFEIATSTKTPERLLNSTGTDAVGDVDNASEFFECFEGFLGNLFVARSDLGGKSARQD